MALTKPSISDTALRIEYRSITVIMNIKINQGEIIIIIKVPYGQEYIDLDVTIPHEIIVPASAKAGNESEI